jgi:CRISPR/Cas system-associated exonuclease Cas4 (RecB family)
MECAQNYLRNINMTFKHCGTMLGGRNFHKIIEDELIKASKELTLSYDQSGIHVSEITRCSRLSYFERMDPFVDESSNALRNIFRGSVTKLLNGKTKQYKIDDLTIYATVDLLVSNDLVVNLVPVSKLPDYPHPNDLLYANACMFIFEIHGGFIVYFTPDGKFAEFSVSPSKRMFEQVVRRARILHLLLKEKKTPVVEPSEFCFSCKYYQRCFGQQKEPEHLLDILGIGKKK